VIIPLPEPQEAGVVVILSWKAARGKAGAPPWLKTRKGQQHNDVNNAMSRIIPLDGISRDIQKSGLAGNIGPLDAFAPLECLYLPLSDQRTFASFTKKRSCEKL
jgi:hypothetical protein